MIPSPQPSPRPRVTARLRALRFDAGSLALNLIATLGRRNSAPIERLGTRERLREWCDGVGLRPHPREVTDELLAELHEVREAACTIVAAVVHGGTPPPEAVALLNDRARLAPPRPELRITDDGVGVDPGPALTGRELQSVVVRDLIALIGDPERRAGLRVCESPLCSMLYLDRTAARRRRWCSMRRCGNSAKAAKFRNRQATAV
ncbi:CGNR zinc finger domain-containing protein [Streptomyces sp. NPDC005322]|uniref:CGNR zinc finger domain-containing protein n=1 Tax=Streptomyces sp. NPDC005322 TaxID=3157032 RepID=UPI0033B4785F